MLYLQSDPNRLPQEDNPQLPPPAQTRFHALFGRFSKNFVNPLKSVLDTWFTHSRFFSPAPLANPRPIIAAPIEVEFEIEEEAPEQPAIPDAPIRQSRAVQQAAAMQIAQEAARANVRDWILRTESLLNASPELASPHQDPETALEKLSQMMSWRQTSIADYGPLLGQLDPAKQGDLAKWNDSYNQLLTKCETTPHDIGPLEHAESYFNALLNLPSQADTARLHYAGAFGTKQSMLQSLLLALPASVYEQGPVAEELPTFLIDAVRQGAIGSPEALFSYGFDILFNHLLENNPNVNLPPSVESALKFLQPLLPNPQRNSPLWDLIKPKLPAWIRGQGKDPVQQGLLCSLLELIPDSQALLRDECITLLEKVAEGSHASNRAACLAKWKPFLMRKVLSTSALSFPLSLFETLNGDAENELSSRMQGIDPNFAALMTGQLSSHGEYWLKWGYDRVKETYSLTIYASGAALTQPDYPRNDAGLIWPISLSGISLKTTAEKELIANLLQSMSKTTALTKNWQLPQENFAPLTATDLFGKNGFVDQMCKQGAALNDNETTSIPQKDATFNALDMVSHYHAPLSKPSLLRYQALKQTLLEAVAPFTEKIENEPPRLVIPNETQGTAALQLFEDSVQLLHMWAEREQLSEKELREITAFQEQLSQVRQARTIAIDPSEQSLGLVLDKCLESLAPAEGQLHFLTEYRDLLIFALGKDSDGLEEGLEVSPAEHFVNLLTKRAKELETRPQVASIRRPAAQSVNTFEPGWIRQALQSPVVRTFWIIFCFLKRVKSLFSLGYVGVLPEVVRWVTPKFMHMRGMISKGWIGLLPETLYTVGTYVVPQEIQEKLYAVYQSLYTSLVRALRKQAFKFLFPKLENNEIVTQLHAAIRPILAHIPGAKFAPSKPFVGMQDGVDVVYLASSEASKNWCGIYGAAWTHFCPASSMRLLINGETGHPIRCSMTSLNCDFTLTQTADGWSAESVTHPGFKIAKEQTVPLGLVLENADGAKKLLLPQATLPHQMLYAKVDPFLGLLSSIAQSHPSLHKNDNALFDYTFADGRWTSSDPFALVHLLLFYAAHQKDEEFYQVGQDLLRMELPKTLEMELLPLQFKSNPRAQKLYADLLAKLDTGFETERKGWIGLRLPNQVAKVVSALNAYRTLASAASEQLGDPVFYQIYARYENFLHLNKEQLGAALGWPKAITSLHTDALALHALPKTIAARARGLKLSKGISSRWQDLGISAARKMASTPTCALFLLPFVNQLLVSQSAMSRVLIPAGAMIPSGLESRACRALGCFRAPGEVDLSEQTLRAVSSQMLPVIQMHDFSQDELAMYFLTYLATIQGQFGNANKQQMLGQLQAAQYAPQSSTGKQLTKLLVIAGTNSTRLSIFESLRKGSKFCRNLFRKNQPVARTTPARETLDTLVAFKKAQTIMERVVSCTAATVSMIGTFYALSVASQAILASTAYCISPVVSTFTASDYDVSEKHTAMCASMVLSVAFTLIGTAPAKKCASIIVEKPLKALKACMPESNLPRNTLTVTTNTLMTVAQVTLLMLQMQAIMASVNPRDPDPKESAYPVPTVISAQEMDPFTLAGHLVGALPLIKMAYQVAQFMFILQGQGVETIRAPRTDQPEIIIEEIDPLHPIALEVD